jgi:hypothetical protein
MASANVDGAPLNPDQTISAVLDHLHEHSDALDIETLRQLVAYGLCASNAVQRMVPLIGNEAAFGRGHMGGLEMAGKAQAQANSDRASNAAQKRAAKLKVVRDAICEMFESGRSGWNDTKEAAEHLAPHALALSEKHASRLSESNVVRKTYEWLLAHERKKVKAQIPDA